VRAARRPRSGPAGLGPGDVLITQLAEPVTLPAGSPGRGLPCLGCGLAIGGGLADAVMFLPASAPGCDCGNISAAAWWAHVGCVTTDVDSLMRLAKLRLAQHGHLGRAG
jgi:hypothetical protein